MNTGLIESWSGDPTLIGPLYPFVGTEAFFFIISVILWLAWTVWQIRHENKVYAEQSTSLKQGNNLKKALEEYQVSSHAYFTE